MIRFSSCWSLARVSMSRLPNGSSISSIAGSSASARAIATRCFMPPESSCGYRSVACEARQLDELAGAGAGVGALPAVDAQRVRDVVEHGPPREELVELLEDDRAVGPRLERPAVADGDLARDRVDEAGDRLQQRGFPQPDGPITITLSRCATEKVASATASVNPAGVQ